MRTHAKKYPFRRLLLLAWLISALPSWAQPPEKTRAVTPLDGQFLVASPKMTDPHFRHCVIFMIAHDGDGALGLVVNRILGAISLGVLFGEQGVPRNGGFRVSLHYGGPVALERGFVLHTTDYAGQDTQVFRGGIALTTDPGVVRAVAEGRGPKHSVFVAGYSGWAGGQLEREVARGDWLTAPADSNLLFSVDADADTLWELALRRAGLNL